MQFDFIICSSQGLPKYIKNKVETICFYLILSFLEKQKKRSRISPPASLCMIFEDYYLIDFTSWGIWQNVYCNCLFPGCDIISFKTKLNLFIKPFFVFNITPKISRKRFKISWEQKEFLRWSKMHFSSFLKGFH